MVFRTNNQAETINEGLSGVGIPCRILGRGNAGGGVRSQEIISILKQYAKENESSFRLCEMKANEFLENFSLHHSLGREDESQLTNQIMLMIGDGWENAMARNLIDELNILAPADDYDARADTVTLMTLHMAKGLEFRVVFICGVEDGIIPYRSGKKSADLEEERRLFYVGMTRARDELLLVHRRKSYLYGRRMDMLPSPFLLEIPEAAIQKIVIPDKQQKPQRKKQMKLF